MSHSRSRSMRVTRVGERSRKSLVSTAFPGTINLEEEEQVFVMNPDALRFDGMTPDSYVFDVIRLQNVSQQRQIFRIIPPRMRCFTLEYKEHSGSLAPGLYLDIKVVFNGSLAPTDRDQENNQMGEASLFGPAGLPVQGLHDSFKVIGGVSNPMSEEVPAMAEVTLQAFGERAVMSYPDLIDMGRVVQELVSEHKFELRNVGQKTAHFAFRTESGSAFKVSPSEGRLDAGKSTTVTISCNCVNEEGTVRGEIGLTVNGDACQSITVNAHCISESFQVYHLDSSAPESKRPTTGESKPRHSIAGPCSEIDFGPLYFGVARTVKAVLRNDSPHASTFSVTRMASLSDHSGVAGDESSAESVQYQKDVISILPPEGLLAPFSETLLEFTLNPRWPSEERRTHGFKTLQPDWKPIHIPVSATVRVECLESKASQRITLRGVACEPAVHFSKALIDFDDGRKNGGTALLGRKDSFVFVQNLSDHLGIRCEFGRAAQFRCVPDIISLPPGKKGRVLVSFLPKQLGKFKRRLHVNMFTGSDRSLVREWDIMLFGSCVNPGPLARGGGGGGVKRDLVGGTDKLPEDFVPELDLVREDLSPGQHQSSPDEADTLPEAKGGHGRQLTYTHPSQDRLMVRIGPNTTNVLPPVASPRKMRQMDMNGSATQKQGSQKVQWTGVVSPPPFRPAGSEFAVKEDSLEYKYTLTADEMEWKKSHRQAYVNLLRRARSRRIEGMRNGSLQSLTKRAALAGRKDLPYHGLRDQVTVDAQDTTSLGMRFASGCVSPKPKLPTPEPDLYLPDGAVLPGYRPPQGGNPGFGTVKDVPGAQGSKTDSGRGRLAGPGRPSKAKLWKSKPNTHAESYDCSRSLSHEQLKMVERGPRQLDFGQLVSGEVCSREFWVRNNLSQHVRVQLHDIADTPLAQSHPTSQIIPPGQYACFNIVACVTTQKLTDYRQTVHYSVNGIDHSFTFACIADVVKPSVKLSDTDISFGFGETLDGDGGDAGESKGGGKNIVQAVHSFECVRTVTMTNPANLALQFWFVNNHESFTVTPAQGMLGPRESRAVTIRYEPRFAEDYLQNPIRLCIKDGEATTLLCRAGCAESNVVLSRGKLQLNTAVAGVSRSFNVNVRNRGSCTSVIAPDPTTVPSYISITPGFVVLKPGASHTLNCTFLPSAPNPNFRHTVAFRVRGQPSPARVKEFVAMYGKTKKKSAGGTSGGGDRNKRARPSIMRPMRLQIMGNIVSPDVHILQDEFAFGGVIVGQQHALPVNITNGTDVAVQLYINLEDFPEFHLRCPPEWLQIEKGGRRRDSRRTSSRTGSVGGSRVGGSGVSRGFNQITITPIHSEVALRAAISQLGARIADEEAVNARKSMERRYKHSANVGFSEETAQHSNPSAWLLSIPAGTECEFSLVFTPTRTARHSFELPLTLSGMKSYAGIRRHVTAHGLHPRVVLTPSALNFGSCVVLKRDRRAIVGEPSPYMRSFQLQNQRERAMVWRAEVVAPEGLEAPVDERKSPSSRPPTGKPYVITVNDDKRQARGGVDGTAENDGVCPFRLEPSNGTLLPGQSASVSSFFVPYKSGLFHKYRVRVWVTQLSSQEGQAGEGSFTATGGEPDQTSYCLNVSGNAVPPKLYSDRDCVDFGAVPLSTAVTKSFSLTSCGYENIEIGWRWSQDTLPLPFTVDFPAGRRLSSQRRALPVTVRFSSSAPVNATGVLQFYNARETNIVRGNVAPKTTAASPKAGGGRRGRASRRVEGGRRSTGRSSTEQTQDEKVITDTKIEVLLSVKIHGCADKCLLSVQPYLHQHSSMLALRAGHESRGVELVPLRQGMSLSEDSLDAHSRRSSSFDANGTEQSTAFVLLPHTRTPEENLTWEQKRLPAPKSSAEFFLPLWTPRVESEVVSVSERRKRSQQASMAMQARQVASSALNGQDLDTRAAQSIMSYLLACALISGVEISNLLAAGSSSLGALPRGSSAKSSSDSRDTEKKNPTQDGNNEAAVRALPSLTSGAGAGFDLRALCEEAKRGAWSEYSGSAFSNEERGSAGKGSSAVDVSASMAGRSVPAQLCRLFPFVFVKGGGPFLQKLVRTISGRHVKAKPVGRAFRSPTSQSTTGNEAPTIAHSVTSKHQSPLAKMEEILAEMEAQQHAQVQQRGSSRPPSGASPVSHSRTRMKTPSVFRTPGGSFWANNGANRADEISGLSGAALSALVKTASLFDAILQFLAGKGAMLAGVEAHHLMNFTQYTQYVRFARRHGFTGSGESAMGISTAVNASPDREWLASFACGAGEESTAEDEEQKSDDQLPSWLKSKSEPDLVDEDAGPTRESWESEPVPGLCAWSQNAALEELGSDPLLRRFRYESFHGWLRVLQQIMRCFLLQGITRSSYEQVPGVVTRSSAGGSAMGVGRGTVARDSAFLLEYLDSVSGGEEQSQANKTDFAFGKAQGVNRSGNRPPKSGYVARASGNPLLSAKTGHDLYTPGESILLHWLTFHHSRVNPVDPRVVLNFDAHLADGVVLLSLFVAHVPSLKRSLQIIEKPATQLERMQNCAQVLLCLRMLDLCYPITLEELCSPVARDMMIFVLYLFQVLPDFVPKSVIEFEGQLSDEIVKTICWSNPSTKPVTYAIKLEGASDFNVEVNTVTLAGKGGESGEPGALTRRGRDKTAPKSSSRAHLRVTCRPRFSHPVTGRLIVRSTQVGWSQPSTLVFDLRSRVTSRKASGTLHVESVCYKPCFEKLTVVNTLGREAIFQLRWCALEQPQPKLISLDGRDDDHKEGSGKLSSSDELPRFPFGWFTDTHTLRLAPDQSAQVPIRFLPFAPGYYTSQLLLFDESVGELMYQLEGVVTAPAVTREVSFTSSIDSQSNMCVMRQRVDFADHKTTKATRGPDGVVHDLRKACQTANVWQDNLSRRQLEQLRAEQTSAEGTPGAFALTCEYRKFVEMGRKHPKLITASGGDFRMARYLSPTGQPVSGESKEQDEDGNMFGSRSAVQQTAQGEESCVDFAFSAVEPGIYGCQINMRSCVDSQIVNVRVTVLPKALNSTLEFECKARESLTQPIPLANSSQDNWTMRAVIQGDHFTGPSDVVIPPGQKGEYPITFAPSWVTERAEGTLDLYNARTNTKYTIHLIGTAEEPGAEASLEFQVQARSVCKKVITVRNYTQHPCVYTVESDISFISGPRTLRINANSSAQYTVTFAPSVSGEFEGTLRFVTAGKQFVWYEVSVSVGPPAPEDTLSVTAPIRSAVQVSVEVENPHDAVVDFQAYLDGDGLLGESSLTLGPREKGSYTFAYAPLKTSRTEGSLSFCNEKMGEFWYLLDLVATPAAQVELPRLKCEVGSVCTQLVTVENPTDQALLLRGWSSSPHIFSLAPRQVYIPRYESAQFSIEYNPSQLGRDEQEAVIQLEHPEYGLWSYKCSGEGLPPSEMDPIRLPAVIGGASGSTVITVRNPFDRVITLNIWLDNQEGGGSLRRPVTSQSTAGEMDGSELTRSSQEEGGFSLLLRRTAHVAVGPFGGLQIPVSFRATRMHPYFAKLYVQADNDLRWLYPLHGIAQGPVSSHRVLITTAARQPIKKSVTLPLTGLSEDISNAGGHRVEYQVSFEPNLEASVTEGAVGGGRELTDNEGDEFDTGAVSLPSYLRTTQSFGQKIEGKGSTFSDQMGMNSPERKHHRGLEDKQSKADMEALAQLRELADRVLSVDVESGVALKPDGEPVMTVGVSARPLKPMRLKGVLRVAQYSHSDLAPRLRTRSTDKSGATLIGEWKFPFVLTASAPPLDDTLHLSASIGAAQVVRFELSNQLDVFSRFKAYLTLDSPKEFSVYPATGILEPASANKPTEFAVKFAPRSYGKNLQGVLCVETEDMLWSFALRGGHPTIVDARKSFRRTLQNVMEEM